ncbi:MAG: hypothetical protein SWQ30_05835 [Thermodesulfobacteriota bacterium]|nr:hypothetical protein [Thermodesulfobacteriota bacterium]
MSATVGFTVGSFFAAAGPFWPPFAFSGVATFSFGLVVAATSFFASSAAAFLLSVFLAATTSCVAFVAVVVGSVDNASSVLAAAGPSCNSWLPVFEISGPVLMAPFFDPHPEVQPNNIDATNKMGMIAKAPFFI